MNHDQKVAHFKQMLRDRGYRAYEATPPLWWLLGKLGFRIPPPHFLPFVLNTALFGLPFAGVWLTMMWLLPGRHEQTTIAATGIAAILTGLLFGLYTANTLRRKSKKLRLPDWKTFPSPEN